MYSNDTEKKNTHLYRWIGFLGFLQLLAAIALLILAALAGDSGAIATGVVVALVCISVVVMAAAIAMLCLVEWKTGEYECRNCGHHFAPGFAACFTAPRVFSARRLRCPRCGTRGWCSRRPTR